MCQQAVAVYLRQTDDGLSPHHSQEEKMRELAKPMLKNQDGQYLLKVIDEMKEEVNSLSLTHPEMKGPRE